MSTKRGFLVVGALPVYYWQILRSKYFECTVVARTRLYVPSIFSHPKLGSPVPLRSEHKVRIRDDEGGDHHGVKY
jgi:hypothetical protein